jgi:hypothetical protein
MHSPTMHSKGARIEKQGSEPCDETNHKQVDSQIGQEGSWDPFVCWDCPLRRETTAFFFVGLVLSAPVFLWISRVRTRKRESTLPHRFLE